MKNKCKKWLCIFLTLLALAADGMFVVSWSFPMLIIGNVLALMSIIGFGSLEGKSDKITLLFFTLAALCLSCGILAFIVICFIAVGALWLFSMLVNLFVKLIQGVGKIG